MAFKMKKFSGFGEGSGKKAPMNFNAGLRAASKAGKLDNNPKFKAAVDNAPMKKDKPTLQQAQDRAKQVQENTTNKRKVYIRPELAKSIKEKPKQKESIKTRIKRGVKNVANMPIKDVVTGAITGTLGTKTIKRFTKK
tara:strand:- start:60 stop:473 length:414 start_codon:yes stop_codon:yes gene_type:complete